MGRLAAPRRPRDASRLPWGSLLSVRAEQKASGKDKGYAGMTAPEVVNAAGRALPYIQIITACQLGAAIGDHKKRP